MSEIAPHSERLESDEEISLEISIQRCMQPNSKQHVLYII